MGDLPLAIVKILAGLAVLIGGGELLLRGAVALAAMLRISPLVIGLTVVAFGTSAPELAVSVQSALSGQADLAVGNVVGSNLFNILVILGISALIAPLIVSIQLIRWDVPLMILSAALMLLFSLDGHLGRWEGAVLFAGLVAYVVWSVLQSRRVGQEVLEQMPPLTGGTPAGWRSLLRQLTLIGIGLGLLSLGSRWLVSGAVSVATALGISQLIIGLTIVAAGTSLPEVMTSILAVIRGQRDIAVGNVVGSNIFNVLCVLGLSAMVSPDPVTVSTEALRFDMPAMLAVSLACLPIFFTGHMIARWEGALFLFYYCMYICYLVFVALQHPFTRPFIVWMIFFVTPLTIVTLSVSVYRHLRPRVMLVD